MSTDPAHSLSDSLGVDLESEPKKLDCRGEGERWAVEIDPDAQRERSRLRGSRGGLFAVSATSRTARKAGPGDSGNVSALEVVTLPEREGEVQGLEAVSEIAEQLPA